MSVDDNTSVLVVEDHNDTARMLLHALRRKGIDAEVVDSGHAALEHFAHNKPRVVVMDEMMPDMTGMEVVREMRQHEDLDDVSVLFYTASFSYAKEQEAKRLGAVAWFVKGVAPLSQVAETVQQLCH